MIIYQRFNTHLIREIELHGSSPFSLLFGRAPNNFADFRDTETNLENPAEREQRLIFLTSIVFPAIYEKVGRAHSKRSEDFIRTHRMLKEDYPPGAQVMVRDELKTAKHQPTWEGPFTVQRRKESGNYELKGLDGTTYTRPFWVLKMVAPEIIKDLKIAETLYAAVDHIITHRDLPDGSTQYQVRWENQGPELDSWLFEKDFIDYGPVQKYSKSKGIDTRTKKRKTIESPSVKPVRQVSFAPDRQLEQFIPTVLEIATPVTEISTSIPDDPATEENSIEPILSNLNPTPIDDYWKRTEAEQRQLLPGKRHRRVRSAYNAAK